MKIVCFKDRYVGNKRRIKREVLEIESINSFIGDKLKNVLFDETDCLIEHSNEQIRLPAKEYNKLSHDAKEALKRESESPHDGSTDPRWLSDNYWPNCDANIFTFKSYKIRIGIVWGYDGIEDSEEFLEFVPFEHPIIGDLISCVERRWGEADEDKLIVKYYDTSISSKNEEES